MTTLTAPLPTGMRELTLDEIDWVCGGNDKKESGHDQSGHTDNQKAWEEAAKAITGQEHHCEITTSPAGAESVKCQPVK